MNQSVTEKLFKILPGLNLIHNYKKEYLAKDLFAGLSVAAIVLPIGIAYAALIGLPPQAGLYSSILPMVVYALMGSSRQLILGPDAATCLLVASVITPLAASSPEKYMALSIMVAIIVGSLCILGGLFRLGSIANFLSKPILTGYLNGLAISIILGQLGKLFGFELVSKEFFEMIAEFISKIDLTNVYTLVTGGGAFILILLLKKYYPRLPAPLIAVIIGIIIISVFKGTNGITLVGAIPSGFPSVSLPKFENVNILHLIYESSGIVLISFCSLMLTNKSFASRNGYSVNPNQDFIALGVADIMSGLSHGFVISGADSRTAVNNASGGKTQLVSVFAAIAILICLLFFTGYLSLLPVTVLSAIIISACIGLFDIEYSRKLFKLSKVEFVISVLTSVSVILIGVMPGVFIAVALSIFRLVRNAAHPHISIQGKHKDSTTFQNIIDNPDAEQIPGILILKIESALIFFNADYVKNGILNLISDQKEKVNSLIINAESVNLLDVTAANMIENLNTELSKQGIQLIFARANSRFTSMIFELDLLDKQAQEVSFNSVNDAVQNCITSKNQ
ncbi:MAG: SulP family inorganic anion transporter [Ignavibacteria bacterium]|nr:SulP family inorganic anion transporter [Ignavibacteria bacterium]